MKTYLYPNRDSWAELTQRPVIDKTRLDASVKEVLEAVKQGGDEALIRLTSKFDEVQLDYIDVARKEIEDAKALIDPKLADSIALAAENISKFHSSQLNDEPEILTSNGVRCWRKNSPIEKVGLYIPGGSAPLFSTILMLGIPAKLAGCSEIILTSPPEKSGKINPVILFVADLIGITKIYKIGGAQAIAAMAYGTESIPSVYKIFGPGNQYVTRAKELVQQDGIAIDMPAGPSEVLVIADETSNPVFVAADLLSQAEHGVDSQVILLANNEVVAQDCIEEVNKQIELLPRKDIASAALKNSKAIVLDSLEEAMAFSNKYAPEHLIISIDDAIKLADKVVNAGSVFLGHYSCESAGDYASGTNHTLPTDGNARAYSGVSIDSFVKKITYQELSKEGIEAIGPAVERMAEAEGLQAHRNAVTVRLNTLSNV